MAFPSGIGGDIPDGDRKRLMQRADTFAIGTGTRELKDRDDAKEFDELLDGESQKIRRPRAAEDDVEKQAKETEEYRRDQLQEQAEKRGSTSGPAHLFPGCLTLPGLGVPMMAIGEAGRSESKGRSGGVESGTDTPPAAFSPDVLQGLRDAGLSEPVESLDDPRLGKAADRLNEAFRMSLKGHERVYVWSACGCHQILTVGLHETKVESAAGSTVETLRRTQGSDEKTVTTRAVPEGDFPDLA